MKNKKFLTIITALALLCTATFVAACDGGACNHIDADYDGVCDVCKNTVAVYLNLFAVNDLHGKLYDSDSQPGVEELTTYIKSYAADTTVLLSSGDMWQGSAESNLTDGAMMTEWMNAVGFVSMTLGNHEFDWGESRIGQNLQLADFPFLAINVYNRDTDELADYCAPSVMVERSGIKIGIIGAIGDCYSSISAGQVKNVYFKTGDDLAKLVKAESAKLRSEGADIIVFSHHEGYDGYPSELSDGYVDVVFEGHTHSSYVERDDEGIYHLQGGGENKGISHVYIKHDCLTGKNTVLKAETVKNRVYSSLQADSVLEPLKTKYAEQLAMASRVVGYNDTYRSGNALRTTASDLYLQKGLEKWGEDYDIVLGGGYMSVRNPGYLGVGEVTYSMLMSLFPFDNRLALCTLSGAKLLSQFIETRNQNYFVAYSSYGYLVKDSIDPNATYYVVTDTYSSDYAPNGMTVVDYYDDNVFARDLLAEYIEDGGYGEAPSDDYVLTEIAEALVIGEQLARGQTTEFTYYVQGTVTEIEDDVYGNVYISDGEGNTIFVYGISDVDGTRFGSMSDKPSVGDTVILRGRITNYHSNNVDKIELTSTVLIDKTEKTD